MELKPYANTTNSLLSTLKSRTYAQLVQSIRLEAAFSHSSPRQGFQHQTPNPRTHPNLTANFGHRTQDKKLQLRTLLSCTTKMHYFALGLLHCAGWSGPGPEASAWAWTRHSGTRGAHGPGGPSRGGRGVLNLWPIFSRAEGNCPPPHYLGVGGGVFNATLT